MLRVQIERPPYRKGNHSAMACHGQRDVDSSEDSVAKEMQSSQEKTDLLFDTKSSDTFATFQVDHR